MPYFKCQIFNIMIYLVLNLAPYIAFAKFNVKFNIALDNNFHVKMLNFDIATLIWYYIRDAIRLLKKSL